MTRTDSKRAPAPNSYLNYPSSSTTSPSSMGYHRSPLSNSASSYSAGRGSYDSNYRRGYDERRESKPEYRIISFRDTSQYSKGGISSCGLAAINSASRILPMISATSSEEVMKCLELEETATSIMSICPFWDSDEHLDVQDVLSLPLFTCHLETIRVLDDQCKPENFQKLARTLISDGPSAAIVTKAPEIVALINIPSPSSRKDIYGFDKPKENPMVIFDSHPRSEHPLGAAFLIFPNPDSAAAYLSKLFEVDDALLGDPNNWQTQMLTRFSAHVLRARSPTDQEELDAVYSANVKLLGVGVQMKEAVVRESLMQSELGALRDRLEVMKEKRKQTSKDEAEAERRLEALKKELASAKDFANSLPGMDLARRLPQPLHPFGGAGIQGSFEEKRGARLEKKKPDSKGKGRDMDNRFQGPAVVDDEAAEYERARLERLGGSAPSHQAPKAKDTNVLTRAKGPEQPVPTLSDRELALRLQMQVESERDDFEHARQMQMEEDRRQLEEARLWQTADSGFHCIICLETWSRGNVARIEDCGHETCRDCMRNHIKAQLDHKTWPILCPLCKGKTEGEPGIIHRVVAELVGADEEMITQWNKVELSVVSVLVECPTCKKSANIDTEDFEHMEMLHCPYNCGAYWCKKCSQMGEKGMRHTCNGDAEFDRWQEGQGDVRKCPGCQTLIQRNEGCRHMTCVKAGCNTHFCDRCGQKLVQSVKREDIDEAVRKHYSGNCKLIDYDSSEDEQLAPILRRR